MHVATLAIAPGSRARAYGPAFDLAERSGGKGFDYWQYGGYTAWGTVLGDLDLAAEDDPYPHAVPVSRLPSPLPGELIPMAFVTPRGAFLWGPIGEEGDRFNDGAWTDRVNHLVDKYRGGHTAVLLDGHC